MHNYLITLKIGKTISPVSDVKNSNRVSSVRGKLITLGLFFVENERLNESVNWLFFFFKEKLTLKYLKIVRSSDPRARL